MSRLGPSGRTAPTLSASVSAFSMAAQGTDTQLVSVPGAPGDAVVVSYISPKLPGFVVVQEIQFIAAGLIRIRLINTGPVPATLPAATWAIITALTL